MAEEKETEIAKLDQLLISWFEANRRSVRETGITWKESVSDLNVFLVRASTVLMNEEETEHQMHEDLCFHILIRFHRFLTSPAVTSKVIYNTGHLLSHTLACLGPASERCSKAVGVILHVLIGKDTSIMMFAALTEAMRPTPIMVAGYFVPLVEALGTAVMRMATPPVYSTATMALCRTVKCVMDLFPKYEYGDRIFYAGFRLARVIKSAIINIPKHYGYDDRIVLEAVFALFVVQLTAVAECLELSMPTKAEYEEFFTFSGISKPGSSLRSKVSPLLQLVKNDSKYSAYAKSFCFIDIGAAVIRKLIRFDNPDAAENENELGAELRLWNRAVGSRAGGFPPARLNSYLRFPN